jgi:hypothetical protein
LPIGAEKLRKPGERYGDAAVDNGRSQHPHDFPEFLEWADGLDPHYAKFLLDFDSSQYSSA